MFVQGVRDLQPTDECKRRDVLTVVGDLGQLASKVSDVGFEIVVLSYLDGKKVVVVSLGLTSRCVLGEEHFQHLLEVVERMWRQEVEPI